jgi:nucleotide-binding universal stress UspA family protein
MYRKMLVPTDGSDLSNEAVKEAVGLARALGSEIVLFYAVPRVHLPASAEGVPLSELRERLRHAMRVEAKAVLDKAAKLVASSGLAVEQHFIIGNTPYEAIIATAKKRKCDLIVMASHGRRGLAGVLIGSETQKVLTHSKIPVLVVR